MNHSEPRSSPISYWNERHRTSNAWHSGGDRGISIARNRAFYAHRLGLLVAILDHHFLKDRLRILDAGCGKGWLAGQLVELGHTVHGVDPSESAIRVCRENRKGTFWIETIESFGSNRTYDAIIAMDVLFHILDDELWHAALRNLCSLTAAEGRLIFSDDTREETYWLSDYIVHRSYPEYEAALREFDFEIIDAISYDFANNPNRFLVARRNG